MTPTPTSTLFSPDAAKTLLDSLLANIAAGEQQAYQMFWDALLSFLTAHWLLVASILVLLFIVALVRALMGRWGMLGRILYNYLYLGILFAVGLIWGPDVFVGNIFTVAATVLLYPACYFVTGWILRRTGLRR